MAQITVHARPGSDREEIRWDPWRAGWAASCRARAEDGAANAALLDLFARRLGVPAGRLRWVQGLRGRSKRLEVEGLSDEEVARRLGGPPATPRPRSR